MSSAWPRKTIRFASFEVDPASGELRKDGIRIRLQDQPFKILLALLERPGEVVTREELRQRVWGSDTFVDFDHGLSAAVNRLREALDDSAETPRFVETLARRGYRFVAPVEGAQAAAALPGRSRRLTVWAVSITAVAVLLTTTFWFAGRNLQRAAPEPMRVVQLTAVNGSATQPSFSPDGSQVAFSWNGEKEDNFDIYVKRVGDATALRLTSDPDVDEYPAFSPDGGQIAFAGSRRQSGVFLVSALGGTERRLASVEIGSRPSWSTDGRFLAAARLYDRRSQGADNGAVFLIPVEGADEPRRIITPKPGTWYEDPAFSSDGRQLAFHLCRGFGECQLQVVDLNTQSLPKGEPRSVPSKRDPGKAPLLTARGLAWISENSLVAAQPLGMPGARLWRVPVSGLEGPFPLELAGAGATFPAFSAKGRRLAFTRERNRPAVYSWQEGGVLAPVLLSSLGDYNPRFSHDGRRIAFASRRSGDQTSVWVADADGTRSSQVTLGISSYCGTPRWSPDDRWIAFDSRGQDGGWNIWIVEAAGGRARQLTRGVGDNVIPSWSRDKKWIYFASNRSGRFEVWRAPVDSGPTEQVTQKGGVVAFESTDGARLYYTKSYEGTEGLFTIPLPSGGETQVVSERIFVRGFDVFPDGVYYISERGPGRNQIRFQSFDGGRSRTIAEIDMPLAIGLAVSPDRKTFLFTRTTRSSDLMVIENFP